MPRRLSLRAALAALAVPALTLGLASVAPAGPAYADGDGEADAVPSDDPALQTQLRKVQPSTAQRAVVSRRAKRQAASRAGKDTPLDVTIDQLTPSTLPDVGRVRI